MQIQDHELTYIELLKYGVQQEIQAGCSYSYKTRKERNQIQFNCKWPNCPCRFLVDTLPDDKYHIRKCINTHNHSAPFPNKSQQITSYFYRSYLTRYFESNQDRVYAQLRCFKDLNIPFDSGIIPEMFQQSTDALKKFSKRLHAINTRFSADDVTSLAIFVDMVKSHSPDDPIEFIHEPDRMIFYYDPFEANAFSHQIQTYHIDSTYKLLRSRIPFYAVTGKFAESIVFPFLYFSFGPTQVKIYKFVSQHILAPSIANHLIFMTAHLNTNAVETAIPLCQIIWCGIHVLRAVMRKAEKFQDRSNFETFYNLMKLLVFGSEEEEIDPDEVYNNLEEILNEEPAAREYFDRQWRHHLDRWMLRYRNEGDGTNNISESHFKVLKHQYFPERRNLLLDELVIELYSSVVPSFLIKLQIKGLDSERNVKVIKKVTRDFEEMTQFKKVECISMLEAVQKGLKNDTLDPNIVYSTLKILLQRKHLI
ncbi:hypothetical protein TVAG_102030 [Trichomonas vaginalis G3]|uniref:MULE transposase domain-containing protein n=1 Tax=Trichomonas vaginalis (strain ATCC PRA-98 / G3) TaxID=412133 RepID=A2FEG1_TRIV3|nr:hypothetical protein TVAG_102030 [Trichomonas vaginalis G3]|eukprot:XP_001309628.1 hypothetical protein [Trichomonas vaginalis G3]